MGPRLYLKRTMTRNNNSMDLLSRIERLSDDRNLTAFSGRSSDSKDLLSRIERITLSDERNLTAKPRDSDSKDLLYRIERLSDERSFHNATPNAAIGTESLPEHLQRLRRELYDSVHRIRS